MTDQNTNPQNNSGLDTTVDNTINKGIDDASSRLPQGQKIGQFAEPKADQAANNELNKGVGGMEKDAENLVERKQ